MPVTLTTKTPDTSVSKKNPVSGGVQGIRKPTTTQRTVDIVGVDLSTASPDIGNIGEINADEPDSTEIQASALRGLNDFESTVDLIEQYGANIAKSTGVSLQEAGASPETIARLSQSGSVSGSYTQITAGNVLSNGTIDIDITSLLGTVNLYVVLMQMMMKMTYSNEEVNAIQATNAGNTGQSQLQQLFAYSSLLRAGLSSLRGYINSANQSLQTKLTAVCNNTTNALNGALEASLGGALLGMTATIGDCFVAIHASKFDSFDANVKDFDSTHSDLKQTKFLSDEFATPEAHEQAFEELVGGAKSTDAGIDAAKYNELLGKYKNNPTEVTFKDMEDVFTDRNRVAKFREKIVDTSEYKTLENKRDSLIKERDTIIEERRVLLRDGRNGEPVDYEDEDAENKLTEIACKHNEIKDIEVQMEQLRGNDKLRICTVKGIYDKFGTIDSDKLDQAKDINKMSEAITFKDQNDKDIIATHLKTIENHETALRKLMHKKVDPFGKGQDGVESLRGGWNDDLEHSHVKTMDALDKLDELVSDDSRNPPLDATLRATLKSNVARFRVCARGLRDGWRDSFTAHDIGFFAKAKVDDKSATNVGWARFGKSKTLDGQNVEFSTEKEFTIRKSSSKGGFFTTDRVSAMRTKEISAKITGTLVMILCQSLPQMASMIANNEINNSVSRFNMHTQMTSNTLQYLEAVANAAISMAAKYGEGASNSVGAQSKNTEGQQALVSFIVDLWQSMRSVF